MGLGLYGKHPVRGDFLDTGVPPKILHGLEGWLDGALSECRAELGPLWEQIWPQAPVMRFWLGEDILGQALCGVMGSSQDKVGRRFPLVFIWSNANPEHVPEPPVIDADQHWYDAAEAHLRACLTRAAFQQTAELLDGLVAPQVAVDVLPGPIGFWATSKGGEVADLLVDVAQTDHRRAVCARSYWWVAADVETLEPALPTPTTDQTCAQDQDVAESEQGEEEAELSDTSTPMPEESDLADTDDSDAQSDVDLNETEGETLDIDIIIDIEADEEPEAQKSADLLDVDIKAEDNSGSDTGSIEAAPASPDDMIWSLEHDSSPFDMPADQGEPAEAALSIMPSIMTATPRVVAQTTEDSWSDVAWLDPSLPVDAPPAPMEENTPIYTPPQDISSAGLNGPVSRFYGGAGLPDGTVLAWFLRGS